MQPLKIGLGITLLLSLLACGVAWYFFFDPADEDADALVVSRNADETAASEHPPDPFAELAPPPQAAIPGTKSSPRSSAAPLIPEEEQDPFLTPADSSTGQPAVALRPTTSPLPSGTTPRPSLLDDLEPGNFSFQNPFAARYWSGHGWKFDKRGMSSAADSTARFQRPYQKLMLETRLSPLQTPEDPLVLHLRTVETELETSISLGPEEVVVSHSSPTSERRGRRAPLVPALTAGKDAELRVVATGNRVSIGWNQRILINCEQPAEQSARPMQIEWTTTTTPYRLSRLRLEGE